MTTVVDSHRDPERSHAVTFRSSRRWPSASTADVPAERREALHAFAKAFLRRLSDERSSRPGPDKLFGIVHVGLRVRRREGIKPSDRAGVRPTIEDADGYTTPRQR